MPSLIIRLRTQELEFIDPAKGLYLFGISNVNENIINENTYQTSNRFDELVPGLYNWYVKGITSNKILASGSELIKKDNNGAECYTKYIITASNNIVIPKTEHKLDIVSDIECFIKNFNVTDESYFKFTPDSCTIELDGSVVVKTDSPFIGKITIC